MPTNSEKEAIYSRIRALCEIIYDECLKNREFFTRIEAVLLSSEVKISLQQKSPTQSKLMINTVEVLHRSGESTLRELLEQLTNDDLIRLCVHDGIKKLKDARTLERQQMIDLLTTTAISRLGQGESFTKQI